VTATPPWSVCPAAERAVKRDTALAAAEAISASASGLLDDRDRLAEALAALAVPDAERMRFLAAAAPSPLSTIVSRFLATRDAATRTMTPAEHDAAARAARARITAELRTALDQPPCPETTPAQQRAAVAQIKRWLAANERGAAKPAVQASCVGPAGGYWLVWWEVPNPDEPTFRGALFHIAGGKVAKLIDGTSPMGDGTDGTYPDEPEQLPSVKTYLKGATLGALVFGPGDKLTAVVDGAITGTRDGAASFDWNAADALGDVTISADTLGRSETADKITYWQASAQGVVPVVELVTASLAPAATASTPAAKLLDTLERRRHAVALLTETPAKDYVAPGVRDNLLAALRALDAPAAVVDAATKAAAR
jgi:hypothetical protein